MAIAKRKKRFFDVEIPIIGKTTQLVAFDISELEGKYIKYDLTRILKGKNILLDLKVHIENEHATSYPIELKLIPFYIRRMMRKGTDYVEDSFSVDCKDAKIKIKPFLITRRKVSNAVKKALRENAKKAIEDYLKSKTSVEIFDEILRNRVQKEFSLKMKKIYPLSLFEIRSLKVEKVFEVPKEEPKKESKKKAEKSVAEETEKTEEFADEE